MRKQRKKRLCWSPLGLHLGHYPQLVIQFAESNGGAIAIFRDFPQELRRKIIKRQYDLRRPGGNRGEPRSNVVANDGGLNIYGRPRFATLPFFV
jgi:hypothetical protein